MKKLFYFTTALFLLASCDKKNYDPFYYDFDTKVGLEIKDKTGRDLLEADLVIEKITQSGNNDGGKAPTAGRLTPDVPPFDEFSLEKKGISNILGLTFKPIYRNSFIVIQWKELVKTDTLMAELYNEKNKVFPSKIYWNGNLIWTEGQQQDKSSINIEKEI